MTQIDVDWESCVAEKYSNKEIATIVRVEGLGYAIQDYLNPKSIEDNELAHLWKIAKDAMNEIERKLYG